jgi:hypothetical protein
MVQLALSFFIFSLGLAMMVGKVLGENTED